MIDEELIPRPATVRSMLARNLEETRLLRRLLRLSERFAVLRALREKDDSATVPLTRAHARST